MKQQRRNSRISSMKWVMSVSSDRDDSFLENITINWLSRKIFLQSSKTKIIILKIFLCSFLQAGV